MQVFQPVGQNNSLLTDYWKLPGSQQHLCNFHMCSMSNTCVCENGLKKRLSNPEFAHQIRLINAMCFVPVRLVVKTWKALREYLQSGFMVLFRSFFIILTNNYLFKTWFHTGSKVSFGRYILSTVFTGKHFIQSI